ncbi:TonB-dependent receptor [Bowmanella dokdonensis]|uniref:TonB-dependent receptor n=1 Tax=Bowmanella dokdonensis TaxID=751969 RepID=A0A939DJG1_9ALTE|nr:TonB-dependent receptor [Bowmanella dokdonensis]MBN7823598.1 TonB-dependent receptor [Bowmanella dokdonensis]
MTKGLGAMLVLGLVSWSVCLAAAEDDTVWHGFVAQGVMRAQDSNFVNDSGKLSTNLTEVGLNFSHGLSNNLRVAGQAVYLDGGNRYPQGARVDYLFADWTLVQTADWQANMHLGRFKNYHWLYSSTRDVPHTRPSIVLPQSIYFDVFRDLIVGNDGLALVLNLDNSMGEWEAYWSYGSTPVDQEQMKNFLGKEANGDLEQDFVHQLSVYFRPRNYNLQMGLVLLDSDFTYRSESADFFLDGKGQSQRTMLNFRYNAEHWEIAAELIQERAVFRGLIHPAYVRDAKSQGGFVQGRAFINKDITAMVRLDILDMDKDDRGGEKFEQETGIPQRFAYMDSLTLGLTWKLAPQWKLQAEYHKFKGTSRLSPIFLPDVQLNDQKYWDMWAVQLMYWF